MRRVPYRRQDQAVTDLMLKERLWCGRHRARYMAWDLIKGKLVPARCMRCAEEAERSRPVPMGGDHG